MDSSGNAENSSNFTADGFEKLRRDAEELLGRRGGQDAKMSGEEILGLIHELQVHQVELQMQLESIQVSIDTAICCGLVLNEILSNSLKYAFRGRRKGTVSVILRLSGEDVEMVVRDDGAEIPVGVDLESPTSLGVTLVKQLVEKQLHGRVTLCQDHGTALTITFPKSTNR